METLEFREFPKISRFRREVVVTEKIDGTNGCIHNGEQGEFLVGSRTRWITPENDNYGFAAWAYAHQDELKQLGPGRHFGEWWGGGCQRGYGLKKGDMRFSLFNVSRWCLHGQEPVLRPSPDPRVVKMQDVLPSCVGLVPIVWRGLMTDLCVEAICAELRVGGSTAVPGFMKPEGIVIHHIISGVSFKMTLEHDDEPKSKGKKNHGTAELPA